VWIWFWTDSVQPDHSPRSARSGNAKEILAEMEFKIQCEVQTSLREFLCGILNISSESSRFVGVSKDAFKFHVAVTDLSGNLSQGSSQGRAFSKANPQPSKRLVEESISYEHSTETKKIAPLFEGRQIRESSDLRCQIARFRKRDSSSREFDAAGNRTVAHPMSGWRKRGVVRSGRP